MIALLLLACAPEPEPKPVWCESADLPGFTECQPLWACCLGLDCWVQGPLFPPWGMPIENAAAWACGENSCADAAAEAVVWACEES